MSVHRTVTCTRDYRVQVLSWELHDIWLAATSPTAAVAAARASWDSDGAEAFRFRDCGIDAIEIIATGDGEGTS